MNLKGVTPPKTRVYIVGLHLSGSDKSSFNESLEEIARLADTDDLEVLGFITQTLAAPVTATYIGKGKLTELTALVKENLVETLVFDNELTPSQARNISDFSGCNVVDRTELILDIFAKHADSKQARLQVELAQLQYSYSRLKNKWKHFSRIEGGIGFRGPGETQIELDRREIKHKVAQLKERIAFVEQTAHTTRKKRRSFYSVALVGYTNAGKSTLFNRLTNESRYVADQLFATLDAKTAGLALPGDYQTVITDTIGFIRKLPHTLISSFHSTLLEVEEADLLLHVVDVSNPLADDYIASVNGVLQELKLDGKNILLVLNKIDSLDLQGKFNLKKLSGLYPDTVGVSARTGENIDKLMAKIDEFVQRTQTCWVLRVPQALPQLISFLTTRLGDGESHEEEDEVVFSINLPPDVHNSVKKQIDDWRFMQTLEKK